MVLFPSDIYDSRRLLCGVHSACGKICAKAREIHLTAVTHRPGIYRGSRSQNGSTSLGFKPLNWQASSLSTALFILLPGKGQARLGCVGRIYFYVSFFL